MPLNVADEGEADNSQKIDKNVFAFARTKLLLCGGKTFGKI